MNRPALTTAMVSSLFILSHRSIGAQQDRIGADATTTPVGVHTQAGRRVSYVCPAISTAALGNAEVWGSDLYVSDSPICIAAIHAGVLQVEKPGLVTIFLSAGADSFPSSTRNGVATKSYGPNATSYTFDRSGLPGQIDWSTKWLGVPEGFATSVPVTCPSGGAMTFQIWGSDVYQEESSICIAAVHAGLITRANGGNVFVTADNGKNNYPDVDRNGVKSTFWGGGATGAFRLKATPTVANAVCSAGKTAGPAPTSIKTNMTLVSPLGADLSWSLVAGAAGFVVERGLASGGTPVKIASTCEAPDGFQADPNQIVFLDRTGGIEPGATYVYVVQAFGSDGQMGWNSVRWTAPDLPLMRLSPIQANGSTVALHWAFSAIDAHLKIPMTEPTDFLVTSDYGYSKILPRTQFTTCGCDLTVLGVPLGSHTFTVTARWTPDVKSSDTKSITIAP